jgi:hypothetical protein
MASPFHTLSSFTNHEYFGSARPRREAAQLRQQHYISLRAKIKVQHGLGSKGARDAGCNTVRTAACG